MCFFFRLDTLNDDAHFARSFNIIYFCFDWWFGSGSMRLYDCM